MNQPPIVDAIQRDKYFRGNEKSWQDVVRRVCDSVYTNDGSLDAKVEARDLMERYLWMPGGRILGGAGAGNRVTLFNCFVSPLLQDSMRTQTDRPGKGIMDCLSDVAYSMQMGGGVGTDFSPLRPNGAPVRRTGSTSSGPLPFMDMWDAMCRTIESAGERRGAMMATMRVDHPDIRAFIRAKRTAGRLTQFNVSVLVTDAFLEAVADDGSWELVHICPPAFPARGHKDRTGKLVHVYETVRARDLWNEITESTYEHAEPGVIFIDRVNDLNPLGYFEDISCTNPCGEQPFPPDNVCCLGHVNLARCVTDPFTERARVDFTLIARIARCGTRFLDNVIDVSDYPTEAQRKTQESVRRIGLGVAGLATLLQQMRQRYGSRDSLRTIERVMAVVRDTTYAVSIELAKERGAFPMFGDPYIEGKFVDRLPPDLRQRLAENGIRNGVSLTIAPTGTTALAYGCVDGGLEPTFAFVHDRKVRRGGSSEEFDSYRVETYGMREYRRVHGLPSDWHPRNAPTDLEDDWDPQNGFMVEADQLTVEDHLQVLATVQRYVDASISKTINCPASMSLNDFRNVYLRAYELGCKSCTTYRPSGVRGAVLTKPVVESDGWGGPSGLDQSGIYAEPNDDKTSAQRYVDHVTKHGSAILTDEGVGPVKAAVAEKRPDDLSGKTYKLKWGDHPAIFVVINDLVADDGSRRPYEIFIESKSPQFHQWIKAMSRLISAAMRMGGDLGWIVDELEQVFGGDPGFFVGGVYRPSIPSLIGDTIRRHVAWCAGHDKSSLTFRDFIATHGTTVQEAGGASSYGANVISIKDNGNGTPDVRVVLDRQVDRVDLTGADVGEACGKCGSRSLVRGEGCVSCTSCGHSTCG